eukprot:TRINITY_DN95887_c0_g1_i1.p1 TRINITY_DN95887_c0_g1~~TRINITY_DN95887_c0_g1_i1.p1  ORF type:complete len:319 (-),score=46.44 TRINITY_DN95887_c0_g1_i1:388-1344(-)
MQQKHKQLCIIPAGIAVVAIGVSSFWLWRRRCRKPESQLADSVARRPLTKHRSLLPHDVIVRLRGQRKNLGRPGALGVPHVFDLAALRGNANKLALIVVDMQEAFFPPSPIGLSTNPSIISNINKLAKLLRDIGGTVCWITSDVGPDALEDWSVMYDAFLGFAADDIKPALRKGGIDFGSNYDPMKAAHGMDGPLWPSLDVQSKVDWVVKKDRYSPFCTGGRHQGRTAAEGPVSIPTAGTFETRLRDASVDTVIIAGCQTNICCEATARDAMQLNFKTIVIADACAARTDADHDAALNSLVGMFADIMLTDEIISILE